jgi:hypothetical protein
VILGVLGEGIFEVFTTTADNILQEFNSTLLAITTDQARSAAHSATIAHAESVKAEGKANAADVLADKAKAKSDAVGTRADDLGRQLGTAKAQLDAVEAKRAELEKSLMNLTVCNAPRILPTWTMGQPGSRSIDFGQPRVTASAKIRGIHCWSQPSCPR